MGCSQARTRYEVTDCCVSLYAMELTRAHQCGNEESQAFDLLKHPFIHKKFFLLPSV